MNLVEQYMEETRPIREKICSKFGHRFEDGTCTYCNLRENNEEAAD